MLFLAFCLLVAEPSVSDQIAKIRSDFAALEKSFHAELVAAKHDNKKVREANRVYNKKWHEASDKVRAVVKGHPDDPGCLEGILLLTGEMRSYLDDELRDLALRRKDDPRMGACVSTSYTEVVSLGQKPSSRPSPRVTRAGISAPRPYSLRAISATTRLSPSAERCPKRNAMHW